MRGRQMQVSSKEVVKKDLEYIFSNIEEEFARLSGKNLLVTGGAGFLGYYLVQFVLYWNSKVDRSKSVRLTVFDNYMRGLPAWLKELQGDENLTLVRHDMIKPLPEDMDDFHYIIHAAGIASPIYYRKYPIRTMDANINGLRALLEYCRGQQEKGNPVLGFLYYSSSEIYGDPTPENIPTSETYRGNVSCTGPRACYDESKRYGETLCVNFSCQYHLSIKVARPFNNYGPGLKITDGRVTSDFARDILSGRDINVLSDGTPTRTFCYIADAVVGYFKVLVKGRNGEAYNIGVEEPEIPVADVAGKMAAIGRDLLGYKGKVVLKESPDKDYLVDNPTRRCPLITKARTELGYNPRIMLDEGLKRSLAWYRDHQDAEEA
jgi:UDP-glucuronate decarboxylase